MKAEDNLGKSLNLKETKAMVWQMFLSFLPSSSLSALHIRVTFYTKSFSPCLSVEWRNVKSVFEWLAGCGECLATSPQIMMITWDYCLARYSSKYPVSRSLHSKPSAHAHLPRCYFFVFTPETTKENCCYANLRLWCVSVSAFFNLFTENIITTETTTARTETIFTETNTKNHDLWSRNGNASR